MFRGIYGRVRSSIRVRDALTRKHRQNFRNENVAPMTSLEKRLCSQLVQNGYAISSLEEVQTGDDAPLKDLGHQSQVLRVLRNAKTKGLSPKTGAKDFLQRYYDIEQTLDLADPLIAFCSQGLAHRLARHYLQQNVRITNIDYWLNYPIEARETRISSQKWHRDYEDKNLLKVFIYLTDVSLDNGPMSFVEGSQNGGKFGSIFARRPPTGVVVEQEEFEKAIPINSVKTFTVPKGTMLFADTSGLHRGGYCLEGERFVFTATFTTFAGLSKRNYRMSSAQLNGLNLAPHTKSALTQ